MRLSGSEISRWLEAEREKLLDGDGDGGWKQGYDERGAMDGRSEVA